MTDKEIKPKGRWARKRALKSKKVKDSYRKTARLRLQGMLKAGLGSKRSVGKTKGETQDKIYSDGTFKVYKNQFRYFADWLEKTHPEAITIEDALEFVDEYLSRLIDQGKAPGTITTAKSALAKVFGVESTQFIETPPRLRKDIKRSRVAVKRDKHISSETEGKYARFTSATGLRRAEMNQITAESLFFENGKPMLYVTKGPKGGKSRKVEILGKTKEETKDIVRWIQAQKGRLFPKKIPSHYDNHSYRASYAMRVYQHYARDVKAIPKEEKYIMRKDRAGEVYDRIAMAVASKNLGHTRVSVIAQSYLYQQV